MWIYPSRKSSSTLYFCRWASLLCWYHLVKDSIRCGQQPYTFFVGLLLFKICIIKCVYHKIKSNLICNLQLEHIDCIKVIYNYSYHLNYSIKLYLVIQLERAVFCLLCLYFAKYPVCGHKSWRNTTNLCKMFWYFFRSSYSCYIIFRLSIYAQKLCPIITSDGERMSAVSIHLFITYLVKIKAFLYDQYDRK